DRRRLAKLLLDEQAWVQRTADRRSALDESSASLTIEYATLSSRMGEWVNDMTANERLIAIRDLMTEIAWAEAPDQKQFRRETKLRKCGADDDERCAVFQVSPPFNDKIAVTFLDFDEKAEDVAPGWSADIVTCDEMHRVLLSVPITKITPNGHPEALISA